MRTPDQLERELIETCQAVGPMVVAFSGGVDSTLLAVAAERALPGQTLAATANSASLATGELEHCRTLASEWGLTWLDVTTDELTNPRYVENAGDRCFWCKTALMDELAPVADARSAIVVLGVNVDDLGDHRPGQQAAAERGARFPLVEAKMTKGEIRALAKHWNLEVWDRPAMPCLSSRIPYGTEVSVPLLSRIDRAESALRTLGYTDVRVRHYDDTARIEVPAAQVPVVAANATDVLEAVQSAGYRYVTLDLAGLRSGNLNAALDTK